MSCPYTSPQNGKAKRTLLIINNMINSLLFQSSFLVCYWTDGLHTATQFSIARIPPSLVFTGPAGTAVPEQEQASPTAAARTQEGEHWTIA
jgi:hypothetical protein